MDLLLHLRAFCEVVDQRSFTRAAAELGVPQPVVSRRVAALERHLGGRLLVRDPRGVRPNDRGRAMLPYARDLQVRAGHLREVARAVGSGLTLWLPEGVAARSLVPVRHAAQGIGLEIDVVVAGPAERGALLAGGATGLALVACTVDEADLVGPIGAGVRRPDASRLHLDTLRRRRGDDDRARRIHLGAEDDHPWVRDVVRRAAARAGLTPHQVAVGSPTLTAVADVVEHDDVWLCTPAEAAVHELGWREVADLPVTRGYRLAAGRAGAAATTPAQRVRLAAELGPVLGLAPLDDREPT